MIDTLIDWLINLPILFAEFGTWLTSDLPYINVSPLAMFSLTGITALVGFLLVRLVIGG